MKGHRRRKVLGVVAAGLLAAALQVVVVAPAQAGS
jgi:hypothetical protein